MLSGVNIFIIRVTYIIKEEPSLQLTSFQLITVDGIIFYFHIFFFGIFGVSLTIITIIGCHCNEVSVCCCFVMIQVRAKNSGWNVYSIRIFNFLFLRVTRKVKTMESQQFILTIIIIAINYTHLQFSYLVYCGNWISCCLAAQK